MEETPENAIKTRFAQLLELRGMKAKLAKKLGYSRASISEMLKSPGDPPLTYIKAMSELIGVSVETLLSKDSTVQVNVKNQSVFLGHVNEPEEHYEKYFKAEAVRPITVVVDRSGKELISYVPVKAQAGYRRGFGDPQFVETLPAFNLPINISGTHRMFQVDGASMRQLGGGGLNDGDIVIAQYVEDIFTVKDGRVYVVVTTEGVIVKRCINRLATADKVLVANSDNKSGEFAAIILHPSDILEVWEYKAHISKQLPLATDLWDVINDLTYKQALLSEEVKELKKLK
jgi:transcriptional regulator with XRE-family HTH domain